MHESQVRCRPRGSFSGVCLLAGFLIFPWAFLHVASRIYTGLVTWVWLETQKLGLRNFSVVVSTYQGPRGHFGQTCFEHLRCPVAMGRKGTLFSLVELKGEPFPKQKGKMAPQWAAGARIGGIFQVRRARRTFSRSTGLRLRHPPGLFQLGAGPLQRLAKKLTSAAPKSTQTFKAATMAQIRDEKKT